MKVLSWNNIFFLVGVIAVVVMLFTFDVSFAELWDHLCHAGYWLVPIIGIWVVVYGFNAMSWMTIVRRNCPYGDRVSFARIYRLTVTGYALNYSTPVGGLGGEPYRIMELSKDIGREYASSSVILYAMMHIYSHFWLWFTSVLIYIVLGLCGDLPLTPGIQSVLLAITLLSLLAFYVFNKGYKHGIVLKILGWLAHVPGLRGWAVRFIDTHEEALRNIDRQIGDLHRQDRRAFYGSLLLEYTSRVIQAFEIMFMLLLFGIDCGGGLAGLGLTFLHSLLILAFTSLFANLIGFLPMQLGVQEGGFVLSIAAMGLSAALGLFTSIIYRVREIVWIIIGLLWMKIPYKGVNES